MRSSATAFDCRVTFKPAAEVKWYVDTSFTVRSLRAGADYCFRVVAEGGASQPLTSAPRGPVRRDAIQRDALLARPDVEWRSGDRGLRYRAARAPVTDVVACRAGRAAERRESRTSVDTRRDRGHCDNRDSIGWRQVERHNNVDAVDGRWRGCSTIGRLD